MDINKNPNGITIEGTTQSINDVWFATESRDTAINTELERKAA